jgi:hypothetical protein
LATPPPSSSAGPTSAGADDGGLGCFTLGSDDFCVQYGGGAKSEPLTCGKKQLHL